MPAASPEHTSATGSSRARIPIAFVLVSRFPSLCPRIAARTRGQYVSSGIHLAAVAHLSRGHFVPLRVLPRGSGEGQGPVFDASVPIGPQASNVRPRISCQHQAHRGDESGRELAPPQYDVDERAADATIAGGEWMDGLELRMRDRSLDERGHV